MDPFIPAFSHGGKTRVILITLFVLGLMGTLPLPAHADDLVMPAITLPITAVSMVTAIVAIGGTVLLAYLGPKIAFKMIRKLTSRLSRAVG